MSQQIERLSRVLGPLTINTDATSNPIPYGSFAGGTLVIDSVEDATTLLWYVSDVIDGSVYQLYSGGNPVTTTGISSNMAVAIPDQAFGAPFLFVAVDDGTVVARLLLKG